MLIRFQITVLFFISSFTLSAQEPNLNGGMENGTNFNILYRHDMSGKAYINTRGYGISFHRGKHVTAHTRSFYEIDLQCFKSNFFKTILILKFKFLDAK